MGRPSLAPGRYFRLLLGRLLRKAPTRNAGLRGARRLTRWPVRSFLRLDPLWTRRRPIIRRHCAHAVAMIDLETVTRPVFTWVQQRLVEAGRLKGKTIAIDATTLEANAAMRSIVRRDTGESYQAFLAGARRRPRGSRRPRARVWRDWIVRSGRRRPRTKTPTNPHDPDAKVTKMKDGTHASGPHKAEHAVRRHGDRPMITIVAVTLTRMPMSATPRRSSRPVPSSAAEQVEDAQANVDDRQSLERDRPCDKVGIDSRSDP